jgi:hypothetical protein
LGDGSDFELSIYNEDTKEGRLHSLSSGTHSDNRQNTTMTLLSFPGLRPS